MSQPPARRSRPGSLTRSKVLDAALVLLHNDGPAAVTINGLGRQLGVSGPALYRHFANLTEVNDHLIGLLYADVTAEVMGAAMRVEPHQQLFVMARSLRRWALAHVNEFHMLFNSPVEPQEWSQDNPAHVGGRDFGIAFLKAYRSLLRTGTAPAHLTRLTPAARAELKRYLDWSGVSISLIGLAHFLEVWVQVYGHVTMEALGQLSYALSDMTPLFEACLRGVADDLGVDYFPPGQ